MLKSEQRGNLRRISREEASTSASSTTTASSSSLDLNLPDMSGLHEMLRGFARREGEEHDPDPLAGIENR